MKEIAHTVTGNSLFLPKEATDCQTASLSVAHFFALSFKIDADSLVCLVSFRIVESYFANNQRNMFLCYLKTDHYYLSLAEIYYVG